MRIIYLDTGLISNVGHHAMYCRLIGGAARAKAIPVDVYGHRDVEDSLRQELNAIPLFRWPTYAVHFRNRDPVSGWMRDFETAWRMTVEDLRQIAQPQADDLVYFSSVQPAQFMAAIKWHQHMSVELRPQLVIEFGSEAGVKIVSAFGQPLQVSILDPRIDPRGMLYHHAASHLGPSDLARFRMVTFDETVSAIYQAVVERPVGVVPFPHQSVTTNRCRAGKRPLVISFLGHQRREKGYHLVPEIIRELLDVPDVEFLVHNAAPNEMTVTQNQIRGLAKRYPKVQVDESPANDEKWAQLLEGSDIVVCPYLPEKYRQAHSALVAECVANAIPIVVPSETTISAFAQRFDNLVEEFDTWSVLAISQAICRCVGKMEHLAAKAAPASQKWSTLHGPTAYLSAIISPYSRFSNGTQ